MNAPTPDPEVNALLAKLLPRVQAILGKHFIGMYLDGSLASGDFDADSDIDFVVVSDIEISEGLFLVLQAMHAELSALESIWAIQLEGTYISAQALRHHDPNILRHPNIERGPGERLKWVETSETWNVHRSVLRERGITLAGPDPHTLIDPVPPEALRQSMHAVLNGWGKWLLANPTSFPQRGYQSYIALSVCRILYTLHFGSVTSKAAAARWALQTFGARWQPLLDRAWEGRHNPNLKATPQDIEDTLAWLRFALASQ